MKKIVNLILIITYLLMLFAALAGFVMYKPFEVINNEETYLFYKPNNLTNEEYLTTLESTADSNDVYVYNFTYVKNQTNEIIYYTNDDTSEGYNNSLYEVSYNPLSDLSAQNINEDMFILTGEQDNIDTFLTEINIIYEVGGTYKAFNPFHVIYNILFIFLIIFTLLSAYLIFQTYKKQLMVYIVNGEPLRATSISNTRLILPAIITCSIVASIALVINIEFLKQSLYIFLIPILIYIFLFYIFNYLFTRIAIHKINVAKSIKNNELKSHFVKIYYILVPILLLVSALVIDTTLQNMYSIQQNINASEEKIIIEEYSFIPMYSQFSSGYMPISEEELLTNFVEFYFDTVEDLDGILANFNISSSTDCIIQLCTGYINVNYLEFNPVYKASGEEVTSKDFDPTKINFLVTENGLESTFYKNNFLTLSPRMQEKFNIVVVDNNTTYQYLNLEQSPKVLESSVEFTFVLAQTSMAQLNAISPNLVNAFSYIFSQQSYFVKTDSADPYSTIEPYITENNLNNVVREAPKITSYYSEEVAKKSVELVLDVIILILLFIIVICLLLIGTTIVIKHSIKKTSFEVLNGTPYYEKSIKYALIKVMIYLVLCIIIIRAPLIYHDLFIILIMLLFYTLEVVTHLVYSKRSLKDIATQIKGGGI